jgi:hypothetical protein
MSVRYLVADRPYPELSDSPVLKAMAGDKDIIGRLGVVEIGRERRLSLLLGPGEACSLYVPIPKCEYLGFSLGVEGDGMSDRAGPPSAVIVIRGEAGLEVALGHELLPRAGERWEDLRLDVSSMVGRYARLVFRVPESVSGRGFKVAWSRFEFVKRHCKVTVTDGGYEVDVGRPDGTLALVVESATGEVPIRTGDPDRPDGYDTRFVRFAGPGVSAYILLGAGHYGEKTAVSSEEDFKLVEARLIHTRGAPLGLNPVYHGDMLIYENPLALPKGICLDRSLFGDLNRHERESAVLQTGKIIGRLGSHICGRVTVREYEGASLIADISADKDCMLLLQDTWYPGWRATVDGVETPISRTDTGIRAVPVERGDHELVLEYAPGSFRLGLGISVIGLLLGVAYGAKAKRA